MNRTTVTERKRRHRKTVHRPRNSFIILFWPHLLPRGTHTAPFGAPFDTPLCCYLLHMAP